jgi:hypothetical protein
VQQNDRRTIGRTRLGVTDAQDASIDLLQRAEGRVCSSRTRFKPSDRLLDFLEAL